MNKEKKLYTGIIYKFHNKINNKVYIGQTSNPKLRYNQHLTLGKNGLIIDKAIAKYGISNFEYSVLVQIERNSYEEYKDSIDELETFYIKKYRKLGIILYNQTEEGGGNTWASYNEKREYSPLKQEHKDKIATSLKKYYETHKCRDMSGDKNPTAKKVIGIDVNSKQIVESYSCGKYACQKIGMNYSTFKYKIKNGGILIDNILYVYETASTEEIQES